MILILVDFSSFSMQFHAHVQHNIIIDTMRFWAAMYNVEEL